MAKREYEPSDADAQNSSDDIGYTSQDKQAWEAEYTSVYDTPPVDQEVPTAPAFPKSSTVLVRVMHKKMFNGKYLVQNVHSGAVRLVEPNAMRYSLGEQEINLSSFEAGETPYDWESEIDGLVVDRDQIRVALWSAGLVEKDVLTKKELLQHIFSRGLVPLIK